MQNEIRKDATQKNFEDFINATGSCYLEGYATPDVKVLTTDCQLFKNLVEKEKSRVKSDEELHILDTNGYKLDKNSIIQSWYVNSLYFSQPYVTKGYLEGEIGGNKTLILAKSKTILKTFLNSIVNRHLDEFSICVTPVINPSKDKNIPPLTAVVTADNKFVGKEKFNTALSITNCANQISRMLDSSKEMTGKSLN